MFSLFGRRALVTGAGRGVGAGICQHLSSQGAEILVNDLHIDRCEATVASIIQAGGDATALPFDVTDGEEVANAVEGIGAIDILINNAGIPETMESVQFLEMTRDSWQKYVDLNLYGVLHCTQAVVGGMCERRWGRVITISSGLGVIGLSVGMSLYAAGKGAGIAFMRHLASEVADKGVTANTIALGPMERPRPAHEAEAMLQRVPVGRLGNPDDVGVFCVYLASPEASWITGQTVHLNGGEITT